MRASSLPVVLPVSLLVFLLCGVSHAHGFSQASTVASEVLIEADVLALSESGFNRIGLSMPESGPGVHASLGSFAIPLSDETAKSLLEDPSSKRVHHLTLRVTSDNPTQFNVDSRVAGGPDNPAQTYFHVGLGFQLESRASLDKSVTITTLSMARIRRGPGESGAPGAVTFESKPAGNEIQVPDGRTILLGGFVNGMDASSIPELPSDPDNPILSYIRSSGSVGQRKPEIVLLMTPRVIRTEMVPVKKSEPSLTKAEEWTLPPVTVKVPIAPAIATLSMPKEPMFKLLPPPPASFYTLQVGAFGQRANAEALVERLKQDFAEVFIVPTSGGQILYRVRVGKLTDFQSADQLQTQLRARGFSVFMVYPENQ